MTVEQISKIQKEVDFKIYWNYTEVQVKKWLSKTHKIEGALAEDMIYYASRKRESNVRIESMIGMAISGFICYILIHNMFIRTYLAIRLAPILLVSASYFFRYLYRFFSGGKGEIID